MRSLKRCVTGRTCICKNSENLNQKLHPMATDA